MSLLRGGGVVGPYMLEVAGAEEDGCGVVDVTFDH